MALAGLLFVAVLSTALPAAERAEEAARVDAGTLRHKVLCGYQGWFRCPGDGTDEGWRHWSRDAAKLTPETVTFEMWPDMSEYDEDEQYAVPGFTYPGGAPAHLFSSANGKTVRRHFHWMEEYGIDGVFLQRFLVHADDPSTGVVLKHVRAAAKASGRAYAICYDLTGAPPNRLLSRLAADWKRLVDEERVTEDEAYLHHEGRPVLFVWGFFSDRFRPETAHRLIDFFEDGKYGVTLVGGCEWEWRREENAEWARAFRRFDVLSPWNVGNVAEVEDRKYAATESWADDLAEARRAEMDYLPVVYPGFGWTNLKGRESARHTIPRLGGEFLWRQFNTAASLGVEMVYVAMFDEVDEGTAIFKVTNTPPLQAPFASYDGLPPDFFLRLTGEGSKLIRGERENQRALPIEP